MDVVIQSDAQAACNFVAELIARALRAKPNLVMGLATGRTMEQVYACLVQMHRANGLDFSKCRTFNLDEYVGLPGSHANSYRYYMNHHLFKHVNIDMRNTHLPDGMAENLATECANYEKLITDCGGIDLQLLGIGMNGHLGFNEPHSSFDSRTRAVELTPATRKQNSGLFKAPDQMPHQAITMGMGTILSSRHCLLLATGGDKAEIIAKAIEGPVTNLIPATELQMHSDCTVGLDEPAASQLHGSDYHRQAILRE